MSERNVRYLPTPDRTPTTERDAPLWVFLCNLANFNAANCGLIPPLLCLNALLKKGSSVEATWAPFEVTPEEYAGLVARLLTPDRAILKRHFVPEWQSFQRDPSLDQYTDYAQWQRKALEKHGAAWGMKMATLQHEAVMRARK